MKKGTGLVRINARYMPLAFLYGLCRVRVMIDGEEFTQGWGEQSYEVSPGQHRIAVRFRYCFIPVGDAAVDIEIDGGAHLRLQYDAPVLSVFGPGELHQIVDVRDSL